MTKIIFLHLVMEHLKMGCIATGSLFQSALTQYTLVGKEETKGEERAQYLVGGFGTGALPLTQLGILVVFVYWVTRKAASLEWDSTNEMRGSHPMAHPVTLFLGPLYSHLLLSYMSPQSSRSPVGV